MRRSKVYIASREKQIVELINQKGSLSIKEVCEIFGISASTARTQLNALQRNGLITRTYGGASKLTPSNTINEKGNSFKDNIINRDVKEALVKAARNLISDNDVICLFGGTTTYLLSKLLHDANSLTVVTNSVWIAHELCASPKIDVRMCGGILNHSKGSLAGPIAEEYFRKIHIDKVFIGADSITMDFGATSGDSIMSYLERSTLVKAKTAIVLCDHTKFGKPTNVDCVASFDEIDYIVTDSLIDPSLVQMITATGIKVIIGDIP